MNIKEQNQIFITEEDYNVLNLILINYLTEMMRCR